MPDPTPDFAARRMRAVLLVLTVAVIAYFAFTGGADGGAELSVAGPQGSATSTSAPEATVGVAGVSVQSTDPPVDDTGRHHHGALGGADGRSDDDRGRPPIRSRSASR